MFKRSAILLSTILLLQCNLPLAVQADPVTFVPATDSAPASLQGHLPINKVGALLAADTLAILNGTEITIQQTSTPNPSKPNLFKGDILKSKIETVGGTKSLTGIAYFNGGTRLDRLTHVKCDDRVTLTDGKELNGVIQSADKIQLAIKTASAVQTVKMTDVAAIHSAHAFNFSMPVPPGTDTGNPNGFSAELGRLTLVPTCHTISGGITSSSKKKRIIIAAVAVTLIATSIAVPIAVGCARHHHHHPINQPVQQTSPTALQPSLPLHQVAVAQAGPIIGTKAATAAVPPTYGFVTTRVFTPPIIDPSTGRVIRPGFFTNVMRQIYLGRF